jgi:hypothetical protein
MPRVSDIGGARLHIDGVYALLMTGRCGHRIGDGGTGFCGFDPRGNPAFRSGSGPSDDDVAVWEWLQAECQWISDGDRQARIAAGEPYVTSRRSFGGHRIPREDGWPAWLRDRSIDSVRVFSDDTVAPAGDD